MWAVEKERGKESMCGEQRLPLTLQGERVDKEGWGSPNNCAPVILISIGEPARVRHCMLIIRVFTDIHPMWFR